MAELNTEQVLTVLKRFAAPDGRGNLVSAGIVSDIAIDWQSPNILYATAYQRRRTAFGYNGGGPGSGLYRSTDSGLHWQSAGEPCPQLGGEVDSLSVTAAPAGRVSVLCSVRFGHRSFVMTSTAAATASSPVSPRL